MFIYKGSFGPLVTNTLLIACPVTRVGAVIDPAFGSTKMILEKARDEEIQIEKILLTHSHWDHFADAYTLKRKTQASLFIHPLDAKNLISPGSDKIPSMVPIHPVDYDHLVNDGDTIELESLRLKVIHTPGHSPGGVCYYIGSKPLLISGDTLFQGGIGNLSLPTAEPDKMSHSLKKLMDLPKETVVIPGHGHNTTIGDEDDTRW